MKSYIGTSGFSYREWKGVFYPEGLKPSDYLKFYSETFSSTEINNTFYRIPSESTCSQWASQVPENFRFALKLSQRITHKKRLRDVQEEMEWFLRGTLPLQNKLGCLLVQLPPWMKKDTVLLEEFLSGYSGKPFSMAFEFRHDSWFGQEMLNVLERHGAALCVAETDKTDPIREVTAPFVYLRLRRDTYSEEQLAVWAEWIEARRRTAFVYFKHEREAPAEALRLIHLLGRTS